MKRVSILFLPLALWLGLMPGQALAFRFGPIIEYFAPYGSDSKKTYRAENESDAPIAVQISLKRRQMALDGSETLSDAEDDFVVFPPQFIIGPGQIRSVRIQWLGDPQPETELAYRIVAEQLPVDLQPQDGPSLQFLIRYMASLYIVPPGARSDIALLEAEAVQDAAGLRRLALTLENRGNTHAPLRAPELSIISKRDRTRTELTGEALKGLRNENLLAKTRRLFLLPWPQEVTFGPVDVEFDFLAIR
ncbi:MAG: molecular chaperone [Rhodospirillales bacterium]|nr:molecular chaperone [Rhodospirillales bacterium]